MTSKESRAPRKSSLDLLTLAAALATVVAGWCFLEVASEVFDGDTQALDEWTVRALRDANDPTRPIGPAWLREAMRDLTALGGVTILVLVVANVAFHLWIRRAYHSMWLVLATTLGGLLLSIVLKGMVQRPRPPVVAHQTHVLTTSFPSGHSMNSAVVYLTLGFLLTELTDRKRLKIYYMSIPLLATTLVGFSRVYLGAHYPTDVLAGWTAGAAWAGLCWLVARRLHHAGSLENVE